MSKQATGNRVGEWLTLPCSKGGQSSSEALQLRGTCHFHLTCNHLTCVWYVCTSAQHFNVIISKTKHWSGSCSPNNTWWSYEKFVVLLHFSLENAAFHTGSREIAKGCTETNRMKKEDEQFGHSTLLDFYLPMVSSLVPNMKARRV